VGRGMAGEERRRRSPILGERDERGAGCAQAWTARGSMSGGGCWGCAGMVGEERRRR